MAHMSFTDHFIRVHRESEPEVDSRQRRRDERMSRSSVSDRRNALTAGACSLIIVKSVIHERWA